MYFFGETPISPFVTIAPLVIVITISMIKDGVDDLRRHINDHHMNSIIFPVLTHEVGTGETKWTNKHAYQIRAGDIVVCEDGNSFPCDLLLLASSHSSGKVYVTTDNLDGESTVKTIQSLPETNPPFSTILQNFKDHGEREQNVIVNLPEITVICQEPGEDLKMFEGRIQFSDNSYPISIENIALRGADLRHTSYVIGAAIYTGKDTKLSLNSSGGSRKFSSTASRLNAILFMFIIFMIVLILLPTGLQFVWRASSYGPGWYLYFRPVTAWRIVEETLTMTFIMNYLIPISILVTMEFQQLILALYIAKDADFHDEDSGESSIVNATNIADELGQVEFLFSDKTGTLTQNKMEFRCFTLAGDSAKYSLECDGLYSLKYSKHYLDRRKLRSNIFIDAKTREKDEYISSSSDDEDISDDESHDYHIRTEKLLSQFKVTQLNDKAKSFWMVAALCHTVEARHHNDPENRTASIVYNASSPDEKAILEGAKRVGFEYIGTKENVENMHLLRLYHNVSTLDDNFYETLEIKIDGLIEFDSVRKRMSVLAKHSDGRCFVYTKGAEVSMLDRKLCGATPSDVREEILNKVNDFACDGLRTLVLAMREVDKELYNTFILKLNNAQGLIGKERFRCLETINAMIESNMTLIGVSGVEDKLQPGVKRCLRSLISAGIQVWVLTGDKEETAVKVSQAAGHFPPGLTIIRLTGGRNLEEVARAIYTQIEGMHARLKEKQWHRFWNWLNFSARNVTFRKNRVLMDSSSFDSDSEYTETDVNVSRTSIADKIACGFKNAFTDGLRRHRRKNPGGASEPVGLVIDGETLRYAISPVIRKDFLNLCMNVTTVLCCRMTPLQKAAIVKLVSTGLQGVGGGGAPVTAAVGDGGNDVAMLLEASVGIGIFGNEGRQAVRASDFAVPLFKHLRKLLLVHGHWNYYRISITANFFYFKCVAFVAVHFYHQFYNGFSGQATFESLIYTLYNLTLTVYAPFIFGIFEKHLSEKEMNHRPYLYRLISLNANLRFWYVFLWILDGWWHGTVAFYLPYFVLAGGNFFSEASFIQSNSPLSLIDADLFGTAISIYLVVITNVRMVISTRTLNLFVIVGIILTGLGNMVILFVYQIYAGPSSVIFYNYNFLACSPAFWLLFPVVIAVSIIPDLVWRISSDAWWDYQLALSGVKRIHEKRKRRAWKHFATRKIHNISPYQHNEV